MNADQKQRAAELLSAWRATAYALHADRMADLLQELVDAPTPKPFGYFKAEPFGWTDCAETDDGAIALFAAPPAPSVPDELSGRFTDPTKLAVDLPTWENGDAPLVGGGLISRGVVDFATVGIWPSKPAPEAEPVARVTGYCAGYLSVATVDGRVLPTGTALYTAPPAPSVPPVRSTGQWESSRIADYNRGWNACREAMLAATPQQEPLSDERILSIGKRFLDRGYYPFEGLQPWVYSFARAVEREILGGAQA